MKKDSKDVLVEFGKADERENTQFRIILGGWNGERSRIAAYDAKNERDYDKQTVNHTIDEWEDTRLRLQIDITPIVSGCIGGSSLDQKFGFVLSFIRVSD